ncbi:unnamed protein product [Closterium sp. Naga37s-1]|nr:unnamed protein product [Closterium sp. Naga37s-1]
MKWLRLTPRQIGSEPARPVNQVNAVNLVNPLEPVNTVNLVNPVEGAKSAGETVRPWANAQAARSLPVEPAVDEGSAIRSNVYDLLREARRQCRADGAESGDICGVEYGGVGSLTECCGGGQCAGNGGNGGNDDGGCESGVCGRDGWRERPAGGQPSLEARFRLGKELGLGHFGVVRLCEDRRTGEKFACKTVLKSQIATPEAMRELRAEVLIPLLLQAAQRKMQAQETRGEGDETQQDARKEAEAGRNEGWDDTARGEGAGEAMREVEGERRNGVRAHGEKAEIYGRGVSAARCLKFVRVTDVTETDQSTANRHHNSDADDREAGCTKRSEKEVDSTNVKNYHKEGSNDYYRNRHENGFVRLVDVFEDESAVHIVMEHCEGGDLFEHVARHERLDERQTATIMRQIATAVAKMHEMGVVHRDLKPENILLTSTSCHSDSHLSTTDCSHVDSEKKSPADLSLPSLSAASLTPRCLTVKIADFGLARVLKRGCRLHGLVGSPFYMAPETVRGREYGPEVDVWSLGVIMYTCLSGTLPFFGKNQNAVFAAVCRGEVDLETGSHWPLISHEAKDLVRRMLDVDPNRRIGSSHIVQHPWFKRVGAPGAFPAQCSLTEVKASQSQRRGRFMIFSAPSSPVPVARCMKNVDGAGGASRLSLSSKDETIDKATEDGVLGCSPNSVLDGINFGE